MTRVYEHLLGYSPSNAAEDDVLGRGLVRVAKAAEWFGVSGEDLLDQLRARNNDYPPLYALGPKRHLLLKAQVEQLLSSPKNAFHSLAPISGHALPASRLARTLKVSQSQIDGLLADKDTLPARVITRGHVRYIVSDVAGRLANSASDEAPSASEEQTEGEPKGDTPDSAPTSDGDAPRGLFAETKARAAVQSQAARSCTGSGANAHRGDCLHGVPAEAKQSET